MKIGCIGRGMVGNAIYQVFADLSYNMSFFDPVYPESKMEDVLDADCVFISVPTLPDENNNCDLSIVINVLDQLHEFKYPGVICIKSTIIPGSTQKLIEKYNNDNICYCPEFLKERCAYDDFRYNNSICLVGTVSTHVFEIIKSIHQSISKNFKQVVPVEAELTKYMQNVFNTYKILFANGFYEICKLNSVEYNSVVESLLFRNEIDSKYIYCNEKLRGPSGPCLVKDSLAFNEYVKNLKMPIKPSIFQTIVNDMQLYPKTVIEGTRTESEYFGKNITPVFDA